MTHEEHRRTRARVLRRATGANAVAKAVSVLATFVQVPVALRYLGPESYGAWLTLTSLVTLLMLADLGLSGGIKNRVARAMGSDRPETLQDAYRSIWTAMAILAAVGAAVAAATIPFCHLFDWSRVFHGLSPAMLRQIPLAATLSVAAFAVSLPLAITPRLALAFRYGWLSSLSFSIGSVGLLLATAAGARLHLGFPAFVALTAFIPAAVNLGILAKLAAAHPGLLRHGPDLSPSSLRLQLREGAGFFIPAVSGLCLASLPPILISARLGAAAVVPYQLLQRTLGLFPQVQVLPLIALWPAYTEAIARGDGSWVGHTFRRSLVLTLAFCGPPLLLAPLWLPPFIRLWTGYVDPAFSAGNVLLYAVFMLASCVGQATGALLNGSGHLFTQSVFGTAAVAISLVAMPSAMSHWGLTGLLLCLAAPFVAINLTATLTEAALVLRRLP